MGKGLKSHTILPQLTCKGVTMLLCELRKGIFHSPREGRETKNLQKRATITPSPHKVCHPTITEEKMAQSGAITFSPSLTWKHGLQSQDTVMVLSYAICLYLSPNVSKLRGRGKAWSDSYQPSTSRVGLHAHAASTLMSTCSISKISGENSLSTKVDN